jgi:hypothetical protein
VSRYEDRSDAVEGTVRLAFWNAWLLAPRLWSGGPRMPGLPGWFAPNVDERAPLVARAVANRFDLVALSEVFDASERAAVAAAWPDATLVEGPTNRRPRITGSGLATLAGPTVEVLRAERHSFRSGGDLRDSDTFASKGALLTTVSFDPDLPPIDVVSTHLFAGGDLFPVPGATDASRHHAARMRQVDELVAFVDRARDPSHLLAVVGDFNVPAVDPDPRLPDPEARYRDLAARLGTLGLRDVWADHGVGSGATCTFASADDLPADPDEPDRVLDEDDGDRGGAPSTSAGERIDYLWLAVPEGIDVTIERPRRWAFPGRGVGGGPAGSLSDHLLLSVTLHVST